MKSNYDRNIFVFGSNLAGRHGAGSALHARKVHGAVYGQGVGLQGDSYALPTKGHKLEVLALDEIRVYIEKFLLFAEANPKFLFHVVPIGTGLAGYNRTQIGRIFRDLGIPDNVVFTKEWITD